MNPNEIVAIPKRLVDLNVRDLWNFISVVPSELEDAGYADEERKMLRSFTHGFGNSFSRHAYYRQAYCLHLKNAMTWTFSRWSKPRILDIGCGTGGQAILFAANGASVVGLDLDELQLRTAEKRIAYYQGKLNTQLDIGLNTADVTECDFSSYGKFDVAYSHGCMARYLNAYDIFQRLDHALNPGGLVILKVCNPNCLWVKLTSVRGDLSSREDFINAANQLGYQPLLLAGTTAIPRVLWFAGEATHVVDWFLRRIHALQIHFELIFQKI